MFFGKKSCVTPKKGLQKQNFDSWTQLIPSPPCWIQGLESRLGLVTTLSQPRLVSLFLFPFFIPEKVNLHEKETGEKN